MFGCLSAMSFPSRSVRSSVEASPPLTGTTRPPDAERAVGTAAALTTSRSLAGGKTPHSIQDDLAVHVRRPLAGPRQRRVLRSPWTERRRGPDHPGRDDDQP